MTTATRTESELWASYMRTRSIEDRNALAEKHLLIVNHIASRIVIRLPRDVLIEDLIQWGSAGLLQAIEAFDPSRKVKFSSFCGQRVTGAMYDGLRNTAKRTRNVIARTKELERTEEMIYAEQGSIATPEETAARLKLTTDQYRKRVLDRHLNPESLDREREKERNRTETVGSQLHDTRTPDPTAAIEQREMFDAAIKYVLETCRVTEALILRFHYLEQMPITKIAPMLGRSTCSVFMLHRDLIAKLQRKFAA